MFIENFPDEIDLLAFFESDSVYKDLQDLHFSYSITDKEGITLLFSFSVTGGWIQFILSFKERQIAQYITESVNSFYIREELAGEYLCSEVILDEMRTNIELRLKPCISIKFNSLVR